MNRNFNIADDDGDGMATLTSVVDRMVDIVDEDGYELSVLVDDPPQPKRKGIAEESASSKRKRDDSYLDSIMGDDVDSMGLGDIAEPLSLYPYELYKAMFQVLSRYPTIDQVQLPLLHAELEVLLRIPSGSLPMDTAMLKNIIEDYRIILQQKDKRLITQGVLKYSKRETDIILGIVRSFVKENNLSLADVCPSLRPDSDHLKGPKKELIRKLFDDLFLMIPYRHRDTIKFFVERKLFLTVHTLRGRWTDEEKERLLSLYEVHGPKWARLGRELSKRHEDVRMVYRQLMSQKKGKYSAEEENRLIAAIRQVLGKYDCPVSELPALGIGWAAVAKLMNSERNSVEYQIKWGHLRQRLVHGKTYNASEEDQAAADLHILEAVAYQSAEDATEVNWLEVSRRCCLGPQHADSRWKAIVKKFPQENPRQSFPQYLAWLLQQYRKMLYPDSNHVPGVEFEMPYPTDADKLYKHR